MMEFIRTFCIQTATFNSIFGILLYWVPMSLCIVGYTIRTFRNYREDLNKRKTEQFYTPTDTIGSLIGRWIVTILPILNLWASLFDVAPELFGNLFKRIEIIFNQPLVPPKKETEKGK